MDRHGGRKGLLQQLRSDGNPESVRQADALDELYHAREMAELSADVYVAAREKSVPPRGWARASENPGLLRSALSGSDLTDTELLDMLRPDRSGFRAELYIPDIDMLGPGYKPTLALKGSAGEVVRSDGSHRNTTTEDFLGNNFPQSIGLSTQYYDRGMDVAVFLKQQGLDFDITGHSLAGGTGSAGSAVTGMRAITFNAAGLHPETIARFARQNGSVPVYDTSQTVTAWQVQGELLNDGIQGDLAKLGVLERHRLAGLLSDTAAVMRNVPEARQMLETWLMAEIPESSRPAIQGFLDRLEQGGGAALLRDLPQAAGIRKSPLPAMAPSEGGPVPRADAASMADLHRLASPLLTTMSTAARGASAGSSVGSVVASVGQLGDRGLDLAGNGVNATLGQAGTFASQGYQLVGVSVEHGARAMGEVAAQSREARAVAEAGVHRAHGWLQERHADAAAAATRVLGAAVGVVSTQSGHDLETAADLREARGRELSAQSQAGAAQALRQGSDSARTIRMAADASGAALREGYRQDADRVKAHLGAVGMAMDERLDAAGDGVGTVAARAPLSGAALGGSTGLLVGAAVAYRPGTPWTAYSVQGTVELVREVGPALHESLQRHGMATAVIPSLDAEIARQEQAARALLLARESQARTGAGQRPAGAGPDRPLLLMGESGRALDRFLAALESGDAARISAASVAMLDTRQAREWLDAGQKQLDAQSQRLPLAGMPHAPGATPEPALAR